MRRLLADIGGTNARFALSGRTGRPAAERKLRTADYPGPVEAVRAYLGDRQVEEAVFAMALPVEADWVQLTNSPWAFSIEETREALGLERLTVINDFSAQALAIPALTARERGRARLLRASRRGRCGGLGAAAPAFPPRLQRARAVRAGPGQSGDGARGDRGPGVADRGSAGGDQACQGRRLPLLQRGARSLLEPARRRCGRPPPDLVRPGRGLYRRRPGEAPGQSVQRRALPCELRRERPLRGLPARGAGLSGD